MDRWTRWYKSTRYIPSSSFYSLLYQSTSPFLSSRRIVVVSLSPAFYPIYTSACTCRYSFVHTDRPADTCMDRQQFLTKKPESPSPPPLSPLARECLAATVIGGASRCGEEEEGKTPGTVASGKRGVGTQTDSGSGGRLRTRDVASRRPLHLTRNDVHTTSAEPAPRKRSAFSAPRVRKLPNTEVSVSFSRR